MTKFSKVCVVLDFILVVFAGIMACYYATKSEPDLGREILFISLMFFNLITLHKTLEGKTE